MQRKRVVLFSILVIISTIHILPVIETSAYVEIPDTIHLAQESLTILSPSEPFTWYKDSKVNLIVWTITDYATDVITFDVFMDGVFKYSGIAEKIPLLQSIPIFYSVPLSEMEYGTYNYTIVATDGVEIKSGTIILSLIEGSENATNLGFGMLAFLGFIGGFIILGITVILGPSSLKQRFGGINRDET